MGSISFFADLSLPLSLSLTPTRKEAYKEEADSRWLLTFQEHLDIIEKSKRGFVLQIQQGVIREKSYMQISEEKMGKKWHVPRIGLYAFPITHLRGGGSLAEEFLATAVEKARAQWEEGIKDEVQIVSECFEPIGGDPALPVNGEGKVHGRAKCTWPSGAVYEGDYKDGRRHGKGTNTYDDGAVYVGEFKDGKKNGKGTYTFADGSVYVGEYKDDKRNGKGTNTYDDGAVYVGEFKDGKKNGKGTYTFADGSVYVGEYKDDKRNGKGTYTSADGAVYVGDYKDGKRNGKGTYTYVDGAVYVGEYKNDKMHVTGTYTYKSGSVEVGFYEQGEDKGRGVQLSRDGKEAWLLMDGKVEREVSVAEAGPLSAKKCAVRRPPTPRCRLGRWPRSSACRPFRETNLCLGLVRGLPPFITLSRGQRRTPCKSAERGLRAPIYFRYRV